MTDEKRDIDRKDSLRRCSLFILKVTEMFFEVKNLQTNKSEQLLIHEWGDVARGGVPCVWRPAREVPIPAWRT